MARNGTSKGKASKGREAAAKTHATSERPTWNSEATSARSRALSAELQEIGQRWSGRPMHARRLAAQLIYGADLLEHGLGAPEIREGYEEWIDRLRIQSSPYPNENEWRWTALLTAIREAARQEVRFPGSLPPGPRRETRWLLTDKNGVEHFGEVPTDEEAASEAILTVLAAWPDMARRIQPSTLAAVLPLWRERKSAGGRRGRERKLWPAIIDLGVEAGLPRVSESTVRGIRDRSLKWLGTADR